MKKVDASKLKHGDVFMNMSGSVLFIVLIDTNGVKRMTSFSGDKRDSIASPQIHGKRVVLFNLKDMSPDLIKLAKKYNKDD